MIGFIGFLILALAMIVGVHVDNLSLPVLILLVVIQLIGLFLLVVGILY